jgi:hypothetical protein
VGLTRVADIAALIRQALTQRKEEFVAAWPGYFLITTPNEPLALRFITEPSDGEEEVTLSSPTRRRFEVQRLLKAAGVALPERLSVGRARDCDIVLRHPSVSKLHAHFRLEDGRVTLLDDSSRNGTAVNDTPLIPERRVPVNSGDRIRFGTLETMIYDAADLHQFLQ